jgi:ABC-2 type transport system ATP-binding protein
VAIIHAGRLAALGTVQELKDVFSGRPIVEIRADSPVEAMRALDAMPEVEKTSVFGASVHAVLRPGAADATALTQRLALSGIAVVSSAVVQPSLEDVFLDVVERSAA